MSDDTIQRAAKALKAEADRLFAERQSSEMRDFFAGREDVGWERLVRAVLTAIREPSAAMDKAAAECESSYVGDVYKAMIDAALAEKE